MVIGNRAVVRQRTPCVIFMGTRVDWLWTAQILGFEPEVVFFRQNNPLVRLIRRLLPNATVIVGKYAKMKARSLPPVAFVHGNDGAFPFLFDAVDVCWPPMANAGEFLLGGEWPGLARPMRMWAVSRMGLTIVSCGVVARLARQLWKYRFHGPCQGMSTL